MAKFKKGQGGRPKGAKNKSTTKVRNTFTSLLNKKLPQLENDIDALEPKDRVKVLFDLAKFILPTLKSQELKTENHFANENPLTAKEIKIINEELEKKY